MAMRSRTPVRFENTKSLDHFVEPEGQLGYTITTKYVAPLSAVVCLLPMYKPPHPALPQESPSVDMDGR